MPEIGLTAFVDFISKNGISKVKVVEEARRNDNQPYDPRKDFYRRLRESTIAFSRGQMTKEDYERLPDLLPDRKKKKNFPDAIRSYLEWWDEDGGGFFHPPRGHFKSNDLSVTVNPEIGLMKGKTRIAIKCWFKTDQVPRARLSYILSVMRLGLPNSYNGEAGILDVRRGTLHRIEIVDPMLGILLRGEATSFMEMWTAIGE